MSDLAEAVGTETPLQSLQQHNQALQASLDKILSAFELDAATGAVSQIVIDHVRDIEAHRDALATDNAALTSVDAWLAAAEIGDAALEQALAGGKTEDEAIHVATQALIDSLRGAPTFLITQHWQAQGMDKAIKIVEQWVGCEGITAKLHQKANALRAGDDE